MKLAYGRVSAKDQNPERQLIKFRELGVDERYIFVDKQSGKNFDRPQYQALRLLIREAIFCLWTRWIGLAEIMMELFLNGSTSHVLSMQILSAWTIKQCSIQGNSRRWVIWANC